MKLFLLIAITLTVVSSGLAQRTKTIRGYRCYSSVDDTSAPNRENPYSELAILTGGKVQRFRIVWYGPPKKLTRSALHVHVGDDPIGLEYRITYYWVEGLRQAKFVGTTGRHKKLGAKEIEECKPYLLDGT